MEQLTIRQMLEVLLARMEADKAEWMANQQIELEQRLKHLMAVRDRVEARIKAHPDIMRESLEASLVELDTCIAMINASMDTNKRELMANLDKMDANQHNMEATIRGGQEETIKSITGACPEVTPACLEEKEQAPKETEAVEKSWEVPKGAADEKKFGANEDQAGEQRLAVKRHRQRKKRAQVNGGPAHGRFTRRAVPALLKGHVRKGLRKNRRSSIRGPGKTFRSRIDVRSLKQWQTLVNMARETPEGRTDEKRRQTRSECNSGIRRLGKTSGNTRGGWTGKRDQHLEITKLIFESFIRLREPGDGTLCKCRPLPKRKR
jgi:hypothetical protein